MSLTIFPRPESRHAMRPSSRDGLYALASAWQASNGSNVRPFTRPAAPAASQPGPGRQRSRAAALLAGRPLGRLAAAPRRSQRRLPRHVRADRRACYDRSATSADMTSRATLLLAFTLLGLAAASAATWVHAELVLHPNLSSVCDVNATVNCTEAYSSAYGKVGGFRSRSSASSFFGGLLLLQVSARLLRVPDPVHVGAYAFALSLPGVAFAAYLALASWLVLKVVCLLCVTIDVATLGVCVIGALMTRFPFASLPGRLARDAQGAAGAAGGSRPRPGLRRRRHRADRAVPARGRGAAARRRGRGAGVRGAAAGGRGAAAGVAARRVHGQRAAPHDPGRRPRRRRRRS